MKTNWIVSPHSRTRDHSFSACFRNALYFYGHMDTVYGMQDDGAFYTLPLWTIIFGTFRVVCFGRWDIPFYFLKADLV